MNIFLFYYLTLIAPLITRKFNRYVIYFTTILFIFLICLSRDPFAGSDAKRYLVAIENDSNYWMNVISPTFNSLRIFLNEFLNINSIITIQIISIIPYICFFISSIILKLPLLIILFLSSETFALLSFNAIRQGLSLGFLMLSFSFYIKYVLENQSKIKYKNIILISFLLFISFTSHTSSIVIVAFFVAFLLLYRYKGVFINYKVNRNIFFLTALILSLFLMVYIIRPGIFLFIFQRGFTSLKIINIIPSGFGFGESHIASLYRLSMMYGIYFYVNYKIRNNKEKQLDISQICIINNILHLSFIPFFILLFQVPLILSRLSHFYLIPLTLSFYCLDKVYLGRKLFIHNLIPLVGIIAFSSNAVLSNLITN